MSDNNIYEPPSSDLSPESTGEKPFEYTGPKSVGVAGMFDWIAAGWGIFKQQPGQWIVAIILFIIISMVLSFIPILGQLVSGLITYVWVAGFMIGCQAVREGQGFQFDHLFAGFKTKVGELIALGGIMIVLSIVVVAALAGSMFIDVLTGSADMENYDPSNMLFTIVLAFLLFIPVLMAMFFAPVLVVLQDMDVITALKTSFQGCLKNLIPLILFGIIMMILYFIAMIPLLLGLLVVMPLFFSSMYGAYENIFLTKSDTKWVDEA